MTRSFSQTNSLIIFLENCKRQQIGRNVQPFFCKVKCRPELRCVLTYDWQVQATFCLELTQHSNLGRFNATVTLFKHLKVVNGESGCHPTLLGPNKWNFYGTFATTVRINWNYQNSWNRSKRSFFMMYLDAMLKMPGRKVSCIAIKRNSHYYNTITCMAVTWLSSGESQLNACF